jgi:hypothetical protein
LPVCLPGRHAPDEGSLSLQVLRDALLLEYHHRVEVGEPHHHQEVDQVVLKLCGLKNRVIHSATFWTPSRLELCRKIRDHAGKTMMLTAKISGIMPAELTRSGMKVEPPPV